MDHIIPFSRGGINHPRNYALMNGTLNSYFGNRVDAKLSIFPVAERRQVDKFAK